MEGKLEEKPVRKPRADSQRNREAILAVAKTAFSQFGEAASLDDIATKAGVGPGTLYRHFPTRDELIEAVYFSQVERLASAGTQLAESDKPTEALRDWMLMFIDHISEKLIILPVLNSLAGGPSRLYESSREQIRESLELLVDRAKAAGEVRPDLDPMDLLRALIGVANLASFPDWETSARRLVDLLIAGAKVPAR